jgi:hypothetical protein
MGARRRLPHSPPRWAVIAAVAWCTNTRCLTAAMPTMTGGVKGTSSTLFTCGSKGDQAADMREILDVFAAAKAVCCDELEEQCDSRLLPVTCATAGCARVIDLVAQSCADYVAADEAHFFKDPLDQAVSLCSAAAEDHATSYVITDPALQAAELTTCHGLVIDGAGSEFPDDGVATLVLRAPAGLQLKLTAETLYLPPAGALHVYGDTEEDTELGVLRGTSPSGQKHEFVSTNGVLEVLLSVDGGAGLPLLFGLRIGCVCSAEGPNLCGEHASCVDGQCQCDAGYGGPMCESIVDKCKAPVEVDCGAHGHCDGGLCQCDEPFQCHICANDASCGAHGSCDGGTCTCRDRYIGVHCETPPKPCCSRFSDCQPSCCPGCWGRTAAGERIDTCGCGWGRDGCCVASGCDTSSACCDGSC